MKISSNCLSLAGEYAVASEICRRNVYAQLTLGYHKRTDILIHNFKSNKLLRIEVKAKQTSLWSNQRGISGQNVVLVFVDFHKKRDNERPDFYILALEDWRNFLYTTHKDKIEKGEVHINTENVPVWPKQIVRSTGKPYEGTDVKVEEIESHKEKWEKIITAVT